MPKKKVRVIKENLRIAQERQKSHYDKGKAPREYKVSPTKGVQRFSVKGKLAPRYIVAI
jgi:hypothetical protein